MHIEERTYYEAEQKMEANWILIFILISSISTMAIAVALLYKEDPDWLQMAIVVGAILLGDAFVIFLFKTMKLYLALSKRGFHYKMKLGNNKDNFISWQDVTEISIRKSPATGYGRKNKWKYGEVYAMNLKQGVELCLKNGKKKFFSLKDPEEFKRAFRKMELHLQIS